MFGNVVRKIEMAGRRVEDGASASSMMCWDCAEIETLVSHVKTRGGGAKKHVFLSYSLENKVQGVCCVFLLYALIPRLQIVKQCAFALRLGSKASDVSHI